MALFSMVAALALLDIAKEASEVPTIVLVAHFLNPILVFLAACTRLITATTFETVLGNRLGRMLTPQRIGYISVVVFPALGTVIINSSLSQDAEAAAYAPRA
jgi:putative Ca2+/H+ antiporter (TMEM165/GDT1 family)